LKEIFGQTDDPSGSSNFIFLTANGKFCARE